MFKKIVGFDSVSGVFKLESVVHRKNRKNPIPKKRQKRVTVSSTVKLMKVVFDELEGNLSYWNVPDDKDIYTPFTLHKRVSDHRNIELLSKAIKEIVLHLDKSLATPGCPLCGEEWCEGRPDWCTVYGETDYYGEYDEDCYGPTYGECAISHVLHMFNSNTHVYWNKVCMEMRP